MRFSIDKNKRDKIIRKSETELKEVADNLKAVRKEHMELENVKLGGKVKKIEDGLKKEKVESEDAELKNRVEIIQNIWFKLM